MTCLYNILWGCWDTETFI